MDADSRTTAPCGPGRLVLAIGPCSVVRVPLQPEAEQSGSDAFVAETPLLGPEAVVASGVLQVLLLPPPPDAVDDSEAAMASLAIAPQGGGCAFFCLCPPGTVVEIAPGEAVLVVPDPEASGPGPASSICGVVFEAGGLHAVVEQLIAHGCKARWQANKEAHIAGGAAVFAGHFLAGAISATGQVVGQGVRLAGEKAVSAELVAKKKPVKLSPAAKSGATLARSATRTLSDATGAVMTGVAGAAGMAAAAIHKKMPDCNEQWQEDAKVVGKSALEAGVVVWQAVQETAQQLGGDVAEASAGIVGHRYGDEAGVTARDSLHAVGNLYNTAGYFSVTGAAQMVAAGSAQGLTQSIDDRAEPAAAAGSCKAAVENPAADMSATKATLEISAAEESAVEELPKEEEEVFAGPCTEEIDGMYLGY